MLYVLLSCVLTLYQVFFLIIVQSAESENDNGSQRKKTLREMDELKHNFVCEHLRLSYIGFTDYSRFLNGVFTTNNASFFCHCDKNNLHLFTVH